MTPRTLSGPPGPASIGASVVFDQVVKTFDGRRVVDNVSFTAEPGTVTCIIGPSGAGKSTLLRCVNQLERVDKGVILIDGEMVGYQRRGNQLHETREHHTCRQRATIGMVFQRFNLFANLTALENVAIGPVVVHHRPRNDAHARARELLSRVGLAHRERAFPHQLSGGEQQRVAIARALAMSPKLMLFDEPTSALDPELVGEVLAVMRDLASEGITMLVVTHEIGFAREAANQVVVMDQGAVIETGTASKVLQRPTSERTRRFLARVL